ncbi:GCN5-related N-acetyltransferase domain protein, partial [mine drainage metagenome]
AHHAAAFTGHFDSFLFRTHPDPRQDSAQLVREVLAGRWGEFLPWASTLAESRDDGRSLGSCLFVRAPFGPLLISLQVDPAAQGRGVGRALTIASLRALRARGESVVALNVTEGNARAVRLYESLGFVRSIGPSAQWYSERIVPVRPDGTPTPRPSPEPTSDGWRAGA